MNFQSKYSKTAPYKRQANYKIDKRKYKGAATKKIVFVNDYSINESRLKFTNFLQKGTSAERNKKIKHHIDSCILGPEYFDKHFEGRYISEQTPSDIKKKKRLYDILACYSLHPSQDEIIYKFALSEDDERGFQVFFTSKDDIKYIYLIDLYHLAIPSRLNRKKERFNLSQEYDYRKKYHFDIKDVLFEEKSKESVLV